MPKTILVRYKDVSPVWPGDVAAMNAYNLPQGFDGPKYPGYEENIPGDFLDDNDRVFDYKGPADQRGGRDHEMVTEMEYRRRLYETGGYHSHGTRRYNVPAPPKLLQNKSMLRVYSPPRKLEGQELENFLYKTKVATLLLKHYNPICMELISDITDDMIAVLKKKSKDKNGKEVAIYANLVAGPSMITKPDPKGADTTTSPSGDPPDITALDKVNAVKFIKEVQNVELLKVYSVQESKKSRPEVAVALEQRILELSKPGEI